MCGSRLLCRWTFNVSNTAPKNKKAEAGSETDAGTMFNIPSKFPGAMNATSKITASRKEILFPKLSSSMVITFKSEWTQRQEKERQTLLLEATNVEVTLSRLIDVYLSGDLEKDLFEEKKRTLLLKRQGGAERTANLATDKATAADKISRFLELTQSLPLSCNPPFKRS